MSRILALRHPKPKVAPDICYGQLDIPLFGELERGELAFPDHLRWYTSPLQRCRLLAEFLREGPICVDPRLMEMHFGDWEGKTWDALDRKASDAWMAALEEASVPGGESYQDLSRRVAAFLRDLPDGDCVLVTHAGVIRRLLCWQRNLGLMESFSIKIEYQSVWEFSLEEMRDSSRAARFF